jgi:hypothetical protein
MGIGGSSHQIISIADAQSLLGQSYCEQLEGGFVRLAGRAKGLDKQIFHRDVLAPNFVSIVRQIHFAPIASDQSPLPPTFAAEAALLSDFHGI